MKKKVIVIPEVKKVITSLYTNDSYLFARSIVICKDGDTYNEEFGKILSGTGAWLKAVRKDIKSYNDSLIRYEEMIKYFNKQIITIKETLTSKKDKEEELSKSYENLIEISSDSVKVDEYVKEYFAELDQKKKDKEVVKNKGKEVSE